MRPTGQRFEGWRLGGKLGKSRAFGASLTGGESKPVTPAGKASGKQAADSAREPMESAGQIRRTNQERFALTAFRHPCERKDPSPAFRTQMGPRVRKGDGNRHVNIAASLKSVRGKKFSALWPCRSACLPSARLPKARLPMQSACSSSISAPPIGPPDAKRPPRDSLLDEPASRS
jgi:hypothetical protein